MSEFKKRLYIFLLAMAPISESKVAIPFGAKQGVPIIETFILSVLGNILIIIPVMLLFNKLLYVMRKAKGTAKIADFLEKRAIKKSKKVEDRWFFGLLIFVAIPLPIGGAWTAAMVAGLLQMRLRRAFSPIAIGVVIAATIVTIVAFSIIK